MTRGNFKQNISNIEDYVFGIYEEQIAEQEYLKDDWFYQYLPWIVGTVAIGFILIVATIKF